MFMIGDRVKVTGPIGIDGTLDFVGKEFVIQLVDLRFGESLLGPGKPAYFLPYNGTSIWVQEKHLAHVLPEHNDYCIE